MASAEGGSVPSGVGWRRVSPPQPTRDFWCGELPQRGPGQSSGWKRILAYFEGYIIFVPTYMTKSGRGFALASHTPKFWGLVPLTSVIYTHDTPSMSCKHLIDYVEHPVCLLRCPPRFSSKNSSSDTVDV